MDAVLADAPADVAVSRLEAVTVAAAVDVPVTEAETFFVTDRLRKVADVAMTAAVSSFLIDSEPALVEAPADEAVRAFSLVEDSSSTVPELSSSKMRLVPSSNKMRSTGIKCS
jgi:hypothetical protein